MASSIKSSFIEFRFQITKGEFSNKKRSLCMRKPNFDNILIYYVSLRQVRGFQKNYICVLKGSILHFFSNHCGLVTLYDDLDVGQHSLKQWFVAL